MVTFLGGFSTSEQELIGVDLQQEFEEDSPGVDLQQPFEEYSLGVDLQQEFAVFGGVVLGRVVVIGRVGCDIFVGGKGSLVPWGFTGGETW